MCVYIYIYIYIRERLPGGGGVQHLSSQESCDMI